MDNKALLVFYKLRFLIFYTLIGFFSLIIEYIIRVNVTRMFDTNYLFTNILSISSSIFVAYILNIKFNFKVPKDRIKISIIYFTLISFFSFLIQYTFSYFVNIEFFNNRFQISGALFFIAYFLHRKFTFKNYQKVGLAVHLNNENNISDIFEKVRNFPDFIHIDLIDDSFNQKNISCDLEKIAEIREKWPQKKLQIHIMSKDPTKWINRISNIDNSEIFFHHIDGNDSIKIYDLISKRNITPGIVLDKEMQYEEIKNLNKTFNNFMILCVDKPGFSGQIFEKKYTGLINKVIDLSEENKNLKITLDGGITPSIASKFNVQEVVSASSILDIDESKKQIINFQTSQKYQNTNK